MVVTVNLHSDEGADEGVVAGEEHIFPAAGAPFQMGLILVAPLDEDFDLCAEHRLALFGADLIVQGEQALEPVLFDLFRDIVFPAEGGGPFAGAVGEDEGDGIADLLEDVVGLLGILLLSPWGSRR